MTEEPVSYTGRRDRDRRRLQKPRQPRPICQCRTFQVTAVVKGIRILEVAAPTFVPVNLAPAGRLGSGRDPS
jgi:hypothetical protein